MFRITGQPTSSRHGEILGLIAAALVTSSEPGKQNTIITDYANGVTAVKTLRSPAFDKFHWRNKPTSEWLLWLHDVFKGNRSSVEHVKAHTDGKDRLSLLNKEADEAAKQAHVGILPTLVPPPTAYMPKYVPYIVGMGYAPDTWASTAATRLHESVFWDQPFVTKFRLGFGPSDTPIPSYLYHRSSAHAATRMQFLIRTGRHVTFDVTAKRDYSCKLCGCTSQTVHHIFVKCPYFCDIRRSFVEDAAKRHLAYVLRDQDPTTAESLALTADVKSYFTQVVYGQPAYPSRYWYGEVPSPSHGLGPSEAKAAHELAIRLAAAVAKVHWREVMPHYTRTSSGERSSSKKPPAVTGNREFTANERSSRPIAGLPRRARASSPSSSAVPTSSPTVRKRRNDGEYAGSSDRPRKKARG